MQIVPRPIFDRTAIKLPVNAKDLLRLGSLRIYDLLQLLVNTLNDVVTSGENNIDKEEAFLASLSTALNEWADGQDKVLERYKNMVINYIQTGSVETTGFITSSASFESSFWEDIANDLLTGVELFAPGQEGNEYSRNGEIETGSEWALRMDMRTDGYKWVSLQPLYQAVYDASTVWLNVDETNGAELVDDEDNSRGAIPFATISNGGLMSKTDKSKLNGIYVDTTNNVLHIDGKTYQLTPYEEEEEPILAYGPVVIENGGFTYDNISAEGGSVYPVVRFKQTITKKLGGSVSYVVISGRWYYDEHQGVMMLDYGDNADYVQSTDITFSANSLVASASLNTNTGMVSRLVATATSGVTVGNISVAITLNGQSIEDTTYASCMVNQDAPSVTSRNVTLNNSASSSYVDIIKNTGVTVDESTIASTQEWLTITNVEVGTDHIRIYYSATENTDTTLKTASVRISTSLGTTILANFSQAAGSASGLYGASSALPTSASDAVGTFDIIDGVAIEVAGGSPYLWVAVPTGVASSVTGVADGDEITVREDTTSLSGYTIYYRHSAYGWDLDDTTFTINT